jgi:hypothetical protein
MLKKERSVMKRFVAISSRVRLAFVIMALAVTAVVIGPENAAAGPGLPRTYDIKLTKPAPAALTKGANELEILVKAPSGKPVENADVSIELVMPRTATMAEMRKEFKLRAAGQGIYTGTGDITMAGKWKAIITVNQEGKQLARTKMNLRVA